MLLSIPTNTTAASLPAASFAEAEGTLTNVEGRVQELVKIEDLPDGAVTGFARPDWFIFSRLAEKLKCRDLKYRSAKAVLTEISKNVPGFPSRPDRKPRVLEPIARLPVERRRAGTAGAGPYLLVAEPAGFAHRGIDLSSKVEGLGELALEEGFRLHPEDLRKLRVESGERVALSTGTLTVEGPVKADEECPEGVIYYCRPVAYGGLDHRANLEALYRLRKSPVKVQVARLTGRKRKRKAAPT